MLGLTLAERNAAGLVLYGFCFLDGALKIGVK
jgi:hypothetical protein